MDTNISSEAEVISASPTATDSSSDVNTVLVSSQPKSRLPLMIAGVVGILLIVSIGIILSLGSLINNPNRNNPTDNSSNTSIKTTPGLTTTVAPATTITASTTVTPDATATVTTPPAAPTVPDTSNGIKIYRSNAFAYQLSYPQNWTMMESQAYPEGSGPYTTEELYINSADQKVKFILNINPNGSDGGEKLQTIVINGKNVPFNVESVNNTTSYYFNGKASALGLTISSVDNVAVRLTVNAGENTANAIAKLQGIMNSVTATSAPVVFNKVFTSTAFNYQFNYPQDWNLIEQQAYPSGASGVLGSEDVQVGTGDDKMIFVFSVNPPSWNGTDKMETLLIHDQFVPFGVLSYGNHTEYYFNGSPSDLGFQANGFSKISIGLSAKNSISQDDAKYILTNIVGSLRSK